MKIQLKVPILLTEQSTPITELEMREKICPSDIRFLRATHMGDPTIEDMLTLASRLTGQSEAILNKLDMADLDTVCGEAWSFLAKSRTGGKTP